MINENKLLNALINAGLTYSPEGGDPFPMRQVPCADVVKVVVNFLREHGVKVDENIEPQHNEKAKWSL